MSVAVHMAAASAHAASGAKGAGARGKAASAESKVDSNAAGSASGGASGQDFGALFREQAGMVQPSTPGVGNGKKGVAAEPATDMAALGSELKAQAAGEENTAAKANGQSAEIATGGVGDSNPKSEVASDSPQASLAAQLKKDLSGPAEAGAEIVAAGTSAVAVSDAKSGGKKGFESLPAKGGSKTKEEASGNKEKRETANVAASAPLPVMAVAAAPVVVPIAPIKAGVAATKDTPKLPLAAATKTIPAQGAPVSGQDIPNTAEDHDVPASAPAAASGAILQEPKLIGAGVQPVTDAAANDGVAPAKAVADAAKASTPAASAQHKSAIQASVTEVVAPATAATPAAIHGGEAPNAMPGVSQQVPAIAGAAAPMASAASIAAGSAYDRMDQGATPVMLHSGAQHVSVGVQDPNLGWVEITTQNLGGHVEATLVTASGQSHDALAAQLPAMAQFMEQRDVHIGALAVHHEMPGGQGGFIGNGSGHGSGNGSGGGANYGSGTGYSGHAGSGSGSGQGSGGESRSIYAGLSRLPRSAARPGVGVSEDTVLRPVSYISVRA